MDKRYEDMDYTVRYDVIDGKRYMIKVYKPYGKAASQLTRQCEKVTHVDQYDSDAFEAETIGVMYE